MIIVETFGNQPQILKQNLTHEEVSEDTFLNHQGKCDPFL